MIEKFKPSYLNSKIRINDADSDEQQKAIASLDSKAREKLGLSKEKQPDILYMEDVLVSQGENNNDDIFLAEELASAVLKRDTVKGKPVNWEHDPHQIIGFMYDSFLIDIEGNKIDKVIEDEKFHVVSRSMIWKNISELHKSRAQAIALAEKDDSLFVSMEAFFPRFDYAVGKDIIERNQTTVFLDFALRINGGTGEFDGKRVRRVLRDITFGGKAIVKKPANPESFIIGVAKDISNEVIPEGCVVGKITLINNVTDDINVRCEDIPGSQKTILTKVIADNPLTEITPIDSISSTLGTQKVEDNNNKQIGVKMDKLQEKLDAAEAKIQDLMDQLSSADIAKAKEEIDALKGENDKCLETIKDLKAKVAEKDELVKTLDATKEDLAKANSSIDGLTDKITEIEAEKRLVDRKAAIEKIINLDEEAMAQELQEVKLIDDDEFKAYIARTEKIVSTATKAAEEAAKKIEADKAAGIDASAAIEDGKTIEDVVDGIVADDKGSVNADGLNANEVMIDVFGDHFSGANSLGGK